MLGLVLVVPMLVLVLLKGATAAATLRFSHALRVLSVLPVVVLLLVVSVVALVQRKGKWERCLKNECGGCDVFHG